MKATHNFDVFDSRAGIVVRATDKDNFWMCGLRVSDNSAEIWERNSAVWTKRASASMTVNSATDYELEVRMSGDTLTFYVDGVERTSFTSTFNNTATLHGVRIKNAGDTVDNFQMTGSPVPEFSDEFSDEFA